MKPKNWIFMPYLPVACAVVVLSFGESSGLDGAALSLAKVFWFGPVILLLGFKSLSSIGIPGYSKLKRVLITAFWVLPSMPLSIMSLMGIMLLFETGFDIFF